MDLYSFDIAIEQKNALTVVGLDEAGRGPLAGPVVAAAVVLDKEQQIDGLNDSKKLSEKKREALFDIIKAKALAWAIGSAEPSEIDSINILQASLTAMERALAKIESDWGLALIDGNQLLPRVEKSKQQTVVEGDAKSASIAAASILAKVTRDRQMKDYDAQYPQYEFARHKGYPTKLHREHIRTHGICDIHRKSFCYKLLAQTSLSL